MGNRLFAVARSLVVASLFIWLWTWLIPRWIASAKGVPLVLRWNAASIALLAIGASILIKCVWDFAWTGRGTPAPFDPPRQLVIRGLYRFVRNPMYIGMGLFLAGQAVLLPALSRELVLVIIAFWTLANGFILLYEEPHLRDKFEDDYVHYCHHVRRWLPRLTPFDKESERTVTSLHLD